MASASSTSARSLFADSKMRLADRVQVNVNNVASLARHIIRGSKSSEIIMHSARNFALQEHAVENSENNLKKLQLLYIHLGYQHDSILRSAQQIEEVKEQVRAMQRHTLQRPTADYVKLLKYLNMISQLKYKPKINIEDFVPVFRKAASFPEKIALRDSLGNYTYGNLSKAAKELSEELSEKINTKINSQILFLCPNDASYVITQWAIWMCQQAAVPVSCESSAEMIKYFAMDSESTLLITTPEYADLMRPIAISTKKELMILDKNIKENALIRTTELYKFEFMHQFDTNNTNAMILYKSGNGGNPKGVVLTHKQILKQINGLVDAWKWTSDDILLHVLPLNNIHGVVTGLLCPLYIGAKCILLPAFNANDVWAQLLGIAPVTERQKITVFMGDPSVYSTLIDEYQTVFDKDPKIRDYIKSTLKSKMRLMVCGTAALSEITYDRWNEITGHKLIQYYGMAEVGLPLSQRYGEEFNHGYVGVPLKGYNVRIGKKNKENKYETLLECMNDKDDLKINMNIQNVKDLTGELLVHGDGVFKKYYNKSVDDEFTDDNWFKTGDTVRYSPERNMFKVLGRANEEIDLKIIASQIESQLLTHPEISDCAVLAIPDKNHGQVLAALVVMKNQTSTDILRDWMRTVVKSKAIPKIIKFVQQIPKDSMGKVNNTDLQMQVCTEDQEVIKTMSFIKILSKNHIRSLQSIKSPLLSASVCRYSNNVSEFVPVYHRALNFFDKIAFQDCKGSYTYGNILNSATELSQDITRKIDKETNSQVLFLCPNNITYVITQWAIWMSGHTAVPVSKLHPRELLEYYVEDSESRLLITTPDFSELMHKVSGNSGKTLMVLDEKLQEHTLEKTPTTDLKVVRNVGSDENAMIVYTSGTTGKPKGVVFTHSHLINQITTLINAWRWTSDDVILHTLPLNHFHGIVNALLCPLYTGAKCVMLPKFNSHDVWSNLLGIKIPESQRISVFMAVPTIYSNLIQEYENVFAQDEQMTEYIRTSLKSKVRLMVSGSASLPVPVYNKWLEITGHKLLERYGMSEIGMCLSQEYDSERVPGYVGVPLKGNSIRIATKMKDGSYKTILECSNDNNNITLKTDTVVTTDTSIVGELLVKSNCIFKEYYNKPELTKAEFTNDNWFKTGDTCKYSVKMKLFKLLGRTNIDIIKTGGYKVSALQIEMQLLGHPDVFDCSIIGLSDAEYGQIIAAIIVLKNEISIDMLTEWIKTKIPKYSVPKIYKIVKSIPKSPLGKVNKKELTLEMFPERS
ncbi:hypothetical protein FQA39_LY11712 [Lamprigera yunnana]|nr:hypothetical protein FQA39_LY11712 [Lamprigera yunnana]